MMNSYAQLRRIRSHVWPQINQFIMPRIPKALKQTVRKRLPLMMNYLPIEVVVLLSLLSSRVRTTKIFLDH